MSHQPALAFVAAAGGAILAVRYYKSRVAAEASARTAGLDAAAAIARRPHAPGELALAAADVPVEHYRVMHLRDAFPSDAPSLLSPLATRSWPHNQNFAGDGEEIVTTQVLRPHRSARPHPPRAFLSAGPCERIYWDPATVRAAIVTCGGLCPGLNTVVRELTNALHFTYGVKEGNVLGVPNGFRGFYEEGSGLRVLTPKAVSAIHLEGGTVLGSSRGGFDLERILGAIVEHRINILFIVGGDGTHRGALHVLEGATARGLRLSVACVPKTIDNDVDLIDRSFGFETAVEQALVPLTCAHTEALAAKNGVGLVKLMGCVHARARAGGADARGRMRARVHVRADACARGLLCAHG